MSHSVVINVRLYDSQDLHEKTYPEFYIINLWHVQEVKIVAIIIQCAPSFTQIGKWSLFWFVDPLSVILLKIK